jgi:hypothetical protein
MIFINGNPCTFFATCECVGHSEMPPRQIKDEKKPASRNADGRFLLLRSGARLCRYALALLLTFLRVGLA